MDDRRDDVPARLEDHEVAESSYVIAVMAGAVRKGNWEPPEDLRVLAVMGGSKLDFREADLLEGITEIQVLAIMGGVEIVVPPDVTVDMRGLGVMGGFPNLVHRAPEEDAPVLRIRGLAVMGGVEVKVKALQT